MKSQLLLSKFENRIPAERERLRRLLTANVADEQANNEVYVDLQYLFDRISRVNVVLLLGEFNTVDICKNGLGTMNDIGLCYASSGLPKI